MALSDWLLVMACDSCMTLWLSRHVAGKVPLPGLPLALPGGSLRRQSPHGARGSVLLVVCNCRLSQPASCSAGPRGGCGVRPPHPAPRQHPSRQALRRGRTGRPFERRHARRADSRLSGETAEVRGAAVALQAHSPAAPAAGTDAVLSHTLRQQSSRSVHIARLHRDSGGSGDSLVGTM